jgi:hypothetical protein
LCKNVRAGNDPREPSFPAHLDVQFAHEAAMKIRAGYTITYGCLAPTPMLLLLNVHPDRRGDLITQDTVHTDPLVEMTQYVDGFGNLVSRIVAPPGQITLSSDFLIEDTGRPDAQDPSA